MIASDTDPLGLCTECTFNMATLTLSLQVSRDCFRQRSDFCKRSFADIAFEEARGEGKGWPSEKRCTAQYRYLHVRKNDTRCRDREDRCEN